MSFCLQSSYSSFTIKKSTVWNVYKKDYFIFYSVKPPPSGGKMFFYLFSFLSSVYTYKYYICFMKLLSFDKKIFIKVN